MFMLMPNLDIINDVTIAVTWDEIKTNIPVILTSTYLPTKFCHIRCILLLSVAQNSQFLTGAGGKDQAIDRHRVTRDDS